MLAPVCKCGPGRHRAGWSYLDASPAGTAEASDNPRIPKDPWNSFLSGKHTPPCSGGPMGLMFLEPYQAHSGSNSGSRFSSFLQPKKIKEPRPEKQSKWAVMSWLIFIYFKKDLSWILELKCFKSAVRLWHGLWCGKYTWWVGCGTGVGSHLMWLWASWDPPSLLGAGVPCDRKAVAKKTKLTANGMLLQERQTLRK